MQWSDQQLQIFTWSTRQQMCRCGFGRFNQLKIFILYIFFSPNSRFLVCSYFKTSALSIYALRLIQYSYTTTWGWFIRQQTKIAGPAFDR